MSFILYFLLSVLLTSESELHDFHLSKSLIKHDVEEQSLQLTMHLYIDDFEEALEYAGVDSLFMCTKMESPDTDKYIDRYIQAHFLVEIAGKPVEFEYLGKEISESLDGVWLYMEAINMNAPMEVSIRNQLLTEVFPDQKNLVNIRVHDKEKMLMFSIDESTKEVSWR